MEMKGRVLLSILMVQLPSSTPQATASQPQGSEVVASEIAPIKIAPKTPPDNNGIAPVPDDWKEYPEKPEVVPPDETLDPLVLFKPVAKSVGAHDVYVQWKPPAALTEAAQGGISYEVQSRNPVQVPAGDLPWKSIYKGTETGISVSGLSPDQDYQFRVIPSTAKRKGPASTTLGIETLGQPYELLGDYPLKITDVGGDYVTLNWDQAPRANLTETDIFDVHYRVQQAGARHLDGFEMTKDDWKLANSVTNIGMYRWTSVRFLRPKTTYSFKITCRGKDDAFQMLTTSATTKEWPLFKKIAPLVAPPKPTPTPLVNTIPLPLKPIVQLPGDIATNPLPQQNFENYAKSPDNKLS